jgi:MFS transporter, DHA1 family, inner membrane transport protein
VALNTSAVYLGQSVGAATGGFVIKNGISADVVWMALVFLGLAIAMSVAATKLGVGVYRVLR